jgi:hypothetical protein
LIPHTHSQDEWELFSIAHFS